METENERRAVQWRAVSKISGGKVSVRVLSKPTHGAIDTALEARHPVLVKVFINHVIPHWVLVVGKEGAEYLMRDPLDDGKNLKRLSEYRSDVFGVRIVEPSKTRRMEP